MDVFDDLPGIFTKTKPLKPAIIFPSLPCLQQMKVRGSDISQELMSSDVFQPRLPSQARHLDERDSSCFLGHFPGDLVTDSVDELMGNDEHQHVCILHGLLEVRDGNLPWRGRVNGYSSTQAGRAKGFHSRTLDQMPTMCRPSTVRTVQARMGCVLPSSFQTCS